MTAPVPPTAAAAVMKLVQDQLTEERNTKASLETRAIGVITSSGALVTLIFALAALVTKPDDFDLPVPVRLILGVVLAAFAAAAVLALITARPGAYHEVTLESLSAAASDKAMGASALEGEPEIARGLVQIISKSREENARKARFLRAAVTFEAVAALMLTVGVSVVLFVG